MAWARVDDGWWSHRKVLPLSMEARGLWATALSWSCGQREDHVPYSFVAMVGGTTEMTDELEGVGLWVATETGWRIHDWAQYQDMSLSEKRAQAGRKGAKKRWQTDSKPDQETPVDQGEHEPPEDGKPMANAVAIDSKGDGRYPTRPVPTRTQPLSVEVEDSDASTGREVASRPRNDWYDACVAAFGMPERGPHEGVFGRIAALAKSQGHPPEEILKRTALHLATFDFACTPASVLKRWDELGSRTVTATRTQRRQVQAQLDQMRLRQELIGERS